MQLPLQNFRKNAHKSLIHMEAASPKMRNRHFGVELGCTANGPSGRHLKGGGEIQFYEIGPAMQQREKPLNCGDANKCMDSQEPERISA